MRLKTSDRSKVTQKASGMSRDLKLGYPDLCAMLSPLHRTVPHIAHQCAHAYYFVHPDAWLKLPSAKSDLIRVFFQSRM